MKTTHANGFRIGPQREDTGESYLSFTRSLQAVMDLDRLAPAP
jgi:hypothetical protein